MILGFVNGEPPYAIMLAAAPAERLGVPTPLTIAAQSRRIAEHRPHDAGATATEVADPSGARVIDERYIPRHDAANQMSSRNLPKPSRPTGAQDFSPSSERLGAVGPRSQSVDR